MQLVRLEYNGGMVLVSEFKYRRFFRNYWKKHLCLEVWNTQTLLGELDRLYIFALF